MKRQTVAVKVGNILIGSNNPIIIQSMTNTDTADVEKTVEQIINLAQAGSELVRVTVNNDVAAKAIPTIIEKLNKQNINTPIIGDFHYNGHLLLTKYPECAELLAKYRINPGNVDTKNKDTNFTTIINQAIKYNKPIRIGVNWGSLDQGLLTKMMDDNSKSNQPISAKEIMIQSMVESALQSAKLAEEIGLGHNKIIISAKVSGVQDLISVYRLLAQKCEYPLHLGLTEAGMGNKGIIASTAGLSVLLQEGIGDTIRVSLTPLPDGDRTEEVRTAQQILQSLELRSFNPQVTACPGCGRTTSTFFQKLSSDIENYIKQQMPVWRAQFKSIEELKVAVMGCVVNGPGESKHADIGISLPGTGEDPKAPVYIDGKLDRVLKDGNIAEEFMVILKDYINTHYELKK
jgi:(E)-4-hydroxy-3-methylbut-2-enyl-diphosphate synthase